MLLVLMWFSSRSGERPGGAEADVIATEQGWRGTLWGAREMWVGFCCYSDVLLKQAAMTQQALHHGPGAQRDFQGYKQVEHWNPAAAQQAAERPRGGREL